MSSPRCSLYSCESAAQTLEWLTAITTFLAPFRPLADAHVVNFFKDRLWETVDQEWMRCLRNEPIENLLKIPAGFVMEHWPISLQKFIITLRSLSIPRESQPLGKIFPDVHVTSLGSVLAQGMNAKKKHEVEVLAAVVNTIANDVGAQKVIDVGAGQGYLAQVLSFQYHLSVIALDASSHHSSVTSRRAERIRKHYAAQLRKSSSGNRNLNMPETITCRVLSSSALSALSIRILHEKPIEPKETERHLISEGVNTDTTKQAPVANQDSASSLVFAGLHACGDLSVNMLRTFAECEQVKALVCVGCCYNLLSDDNFQKFSPCGFPMSNFLQSTGISLTKNARDLACQSAERWENLSKDDALQNFELHLFRAAFQMVLDKCYPDVLFSSPSVGRKGKALRRLRMRRTLHSRLDNEETDVSANIDYDNAHKESHCLNLKSFVPEEREHNKGNMVCPIPNGFASCVCVEAPECVKSDKYDLFEEFSKSSLSHLGIEPPQDFNLQEVWREYHCFLDLVGPYWSLRAALAPLLETYILLDRLLFLQEKDCSLKIMMLPLFDPVLSPRNMAIVAQR